ncbi:hypothetical protein BG006_006017 [Podila minutissima]|uniref:Uncharacterized protein n=1 Tax=Podila minutissima TaxID=64525 RepID=A0A9P5SK19_9FUNG|nr:hypothetical protein BG006_006017 [Podila minutissima]
MTVLCDDRFRFLSEPEYYNLPDIDGSENDEQEENTVWVILDVLSRDLFESGLVDFSQHIDLHSLNRALASSAENGTNGAVQGMGGGAGLGTHQHPPVEYHPPLTSHNSSLEEYQPPLVETPSQSHGLNQLDLHEALRQLSLVDEEQSIERGFDRAFNPGEEEDIALTEEEDLEITRQQAETRAALASVCTEFAI